MKKYENVKYIASVRDKANGHLTVIRSEYRTKKDFRTDLINNGYSVRFIATEETFDDECENGTSETKSQKSRTGFGVRATRSLPTSTAYRSRTTAGRTRLTWKP